MENPPFEDVFPIQDGDFPLLCLFTGGYMVCCQEFRPSAGGISTPPEASEIRF